MKPKVVLLTMFEPSAHTPGELAVFRDRENLQKIKLPGIDHLYGNPERGLFSLLTGVGTASTAVSVMGLVLGSGWDFSETLWIVCGIAGGNPAQCSLGSAVWADWVADADLAHEIDPREAPPEWPTGIFPLGARAPYAPPAGTISCRGPPIRFSACISQRLTGHMALPKTHRCSPRPSWPVCVAATRNTPQRIGHLPYCAAIL